MLQREDGKWFATISRGPRDAQRKTRRICDSERVAREALRRLRAEASTPIRDDAPPPRLERYLEEWLANMKRRVREKMCSDYEATVRLHVVPFLGTLRIVRIKPLHAMHLMAELEGGGPKGATIGARARARVASRQSSARARRSRPGEQGAALLRRPNVHGLPSDARLRARPAEPDSRRSAFRRLLESRTAGGWRGWTAEAPTIFRVACRSDSAAAKSARAGGATSTSSAAGCTSSPCSRQSARRLSKTRGSRRTIEASKPRRGGAGGPTRAPKGRRAPKVAP